MLRPIVLIEDSSQDIELTLAAFSKVQLGNRVVVLRDGEDAVDFFSCTGRYESREQSTPALVLLDIKLPKRNGLEILEHLKCDPKLKSIPVVMLTSSREEPDLARSYALGANGYVVKPVLFHDFNKAVQDLSCFWAVVNEPPPERLPSESD